MKVILNVPEEATMESIFAPIEGRAVQATSAVHTCCSNALVEDLFDGE